jgi:hypothetical protein
MSTEAEKREQRGKECLHSAREARFSTTGEPSEAPGPDDVKAARAKASEKGSKSKK